MNDQNMLDLARKIAAIPDDLPGGKTQKQARIQSMIRDALLDKPTQLERANRIIGWMMPYIGTMCPPSNGLFDLNQHCCENIVPEPGDETKGASIRQHAAGARPSGVLRGKS